MLNCVVIAGRIVRDPELRRTGSGKAVTSFTVACDRDFKNQQTGEKEVDFFDCVAWGAAGENAARYFSKGQNGNGYRTAANQAVYRQERPEPKADGNSGEQPLFLRQQGGKLSAERRGQRCPERAKHPPLCAGGM